MGALRAHGQADGIDRSFLLGFGVVCSVGGRDAATEAGMVAHPMGSIFCCSSGQIGAILASVD